MANQLEIFMSGQQFKQLCEKHYESIMKKYALTKIEIDILFFLYTTSFQTAKDIVRIRHISKSHVSSAVENLHKKGYVHCNPDEKDHRKTNITLSSSANSLIQEITVLHEKMLDVLFEGITKEEKEFMKSIVSKMLFNISNALEESETPKNL